MPLDHDGDVGQGVYTCTLRGVLFSLMQGGLFVSAAKKKVIEDVFLAAFFNQEGRKIIKLQLFFKKSCFFVRIFVWEK